MLEQATKIADARHDPRVFGGLVGDTLPQIYGFLLWWLGHRTLAEQITRDTYLAALEQVHEYSASEDGFLVWLVDRTLIQVARAQKNNPPVVTNPEKPPFADEDRQTLWLTIRSYPQATLLPFLLSRLVGFSPKQISQLIHRKEEEVQQSLRELSDAIDAKEMSQGNAAVPGQMEKPETPANLRITSLSPIQPSAYFRAELDGRLAERGQLLWRRIRFWRKLRIIIPLAAATIIVLTFFGLRYLLPVMPAFPVLPTVPLEEPTGSELYQGILSPEYTSTGTLSLPPELMVYRTQGQVDRSYVEELCWRLDVPLMIRSTQNTFLAGAQEELLIWSASGGFLYRPWQERSGRDLSSDEAIARARQFLQEHQLWPADVGGSRTILVDPAQGLIGIAFDRTAGELLVAGSRIEVFFHGEQLERIVYNWRPLLPFKKYPILGQDQLDQALRQAGFSGSFDSLRLVYQEALPEVNQEFLLPLFAVSGRNPGSGQLSLRKFWALEAAYLSP
jgi:DNA-directed RNA polymerase specialized sigma24 family protein